MTLGESLGLHEQDKGVRKKIKGVLETVLLGIRIRRAVWWYDMDEQSYYNRLLRIGARLQSYHAWLNAQLLNPNAKVDFSSIGRVYTDVVSLTLRLGGDVDRYRHLKVIISVLLANRTAYVLAAHPYYLPEKLAGVADEDYDDETHGGVSQDYADKWDCLEHPMHTKYVKTPEDVDSDTPDFSQWGRVYYLRKGYAEIAHFLVVRKMLKRYERLCFYMDSARELRAGAMVALAPDILAGRAEVVLLQQNTKKRRRSNEDKLFMGRIDSDEREAALRKAWEKREPIVQRKFAKAAKDAAAKGKDLEPDRIAAQEYKNAAIGAFSKDGNWAWLRYPAPLGDQKEWRTLWFTRRPGKTFADVVKHLQFATIQPVDSVIGSLRDRVLSHHRPIRRAGQGLSFRKNYVDPLGVVSEASIYLIGRNYTYMSKGQTTTPARELRLYVSRPPFASVRSLSRVVEQFQLGLSEAEQISQWRHL